MKTRERTSPAIDASGDGKMAFIQRVEVQARSAGAKSFSQTDNGCTFTLNNVAYETLYDGSQDFEGATNDSVLATFFKNFEGDKPAAGQFTKIIAINEGKLRDFLLGNSRTRVTSITSGRAKSKCPSVFF